MSDSILTAITLALRSEIATIAEEEITAAQKRIADRVHEKLGQVAMNVFSAYSIERREDRVIIEVRNGQQEPRK